jgi:hypothetical protein
VVTKGGKVLVFRKDPTPAEVAAATSDPYEDWDPAPLAEPAPPSRTGQNDRLSAAVASAIAGQIDRSEGGR